MKWMEMRYKELIFLGSPSLQMCASLVATPFLREELVFKETKLH